MTLPSISEYGSLEAPLNCMIRDSEAFKHSLFKGREASFLL